MSKDTILTLLKANAIDGYMLARVPYCLYLNRNKAGAGFLTLASLTTVTDEEIESTTIAKRAELVCNSILEALRRKFGDDIHSPDVFY